MESAVFQAASALQTIVGSAGNRYLNGASIAAKVALETFNDFDVINNEESIKKIEEIREIMRSLWVNAK